MENLVKDLQEKAGLTEEQSLKAIDVFKEYIDKHKGEVNWEKFFKGKYEEFKKTTKSTLNKVSSKAEDISDKVFDKVEDLTTDAKRIVRDTSKKVYDKLSDKD